jgi:hypothetical protein
MRERDVGAGSATSLDVAPMPVLARGKHRSPRKGACFMELASYLAGEKWSDHPACTHPLVAALARNVNDLTSDEGRARLAPLIPSVIGLTSDDPEVDVRIALRCAATALSYASAERQRVLAVSVHSCQRMLGSLDPAVTGELGPVCEQALGVAPAAAAWARGFAGRIVTSSPAGFREHAAPNAVRLGTEAIARAGTCDADDELRALLSAAIADVRRVVAGSGETPAGWETDQQAWQEACRLSGARV